MKAVILVSVLFAGNLRAQIIISEFMASNTRTLSDEDGEFSDWIEIFNTAQTNVNLNGWALTDEKGTPRKWRFPAMDIGPGQSMIVFASNKNRRVAGSPLHTDFRLGSSGDFLGLSNPAGAIVFQYGNAYPEQAPDVSFGVVWEEEKVTLLATNSPAEIFVPANDNMGTGWQQLEFPTVDWLNGTTPVGFDSNPAVTADPWISTVLNANPAIFFRCQDASGTIAANLGSFGSSYNGAYTGAPSLNQTSLRPPEAAGMPADNATLRFDGSNDFINMNKQVLSHLGAFTMAAWIRPATLNVARQGLFGQHDAIEFGFINPRLLQLSTANGGSVSLEYPYASNQWHFVAVTGDGETLKIYLDGVLSAEGGGATEDYGSSGFPFVIGGGGIFDPSQNFFTGFIDEFAFYPRALSDDEVFLQHQLAREPGVKYLVGTDLAAAASGVNSTVYVRQEILSTNAFERLQLSAQIDDGFAAFLNGVEVARHNAPPEPVWNSSATQDRIRATGMRWDRFDLTPQLGLLHAGTNLLAIQALNVAPNDPDLFFNAELIGVRRRLDTNQVRYFAQSTPGRINGVGDTNAGPLIIATAHSPALPTDADAIAVTARMMQTFSPPTQLTLTYRVMFNTEITVQMRDDGVNGDGAAGDGVYGAIIPNTAATIGQMVRWYFRATDARGSTSRWPLYRETQNSPQYLGTIIADPRLTNSLPVLHWFVQNPSAADSAGTRSSFFWNGVLYDNAFVNIHGQSSQGFPKKSYNVDFNTGYHFAWDPKETPVEDINLLTIYPDKAHVRNVLAYETFRDAGSPYHFVVPVRVERNGAFFSDAHMVEDGDADYLARVGLNPNGALYKMYNTMDSAVTGAEKKTRKFENNNDLQALISALNQSSGQRNAYIFDNVNIPAMVNFLAAMILTGNVDCCHKNYYLYRDSEGNGEWTFLPWDVDLSFGRNWTLSATYFDDTMYTQNGLFVGGNAKLPEVLFANTAFRQMYLRRLRTLMDELMQPPGTPAANLKYEKRIRELYADIGPDAALDFAKWATWGARQTMPQALAILTNLYMPQRRQFLFAGQQGTIPAPIATPLNINFGPLEVNPASGTQQHEFFSIVNPNSLAVDISGWKIEGAVEHTFAAGTVLPANGTLYLSPNVVGFRQRATSPRAGQGLFIQGNYKGRLSARGETLLLRDKTGREVKSLTFAAQPTAGQQQLRITEILYAPPANTAGYAREDLEYIVLKNIGSSAMNLKGVHFTNGVTFVFADFQLGASESVYIARNPIAFSAVYGSGFKMAGPFTGQLANEGETLELYDANGESILDFTYENEWQPITELRGHSLVVSDELAAYLSWSAPATWTFSPTPGGSAALTAAWVSYRNSHFNTQEIADPLVSGAAADADADGYSNYDEFMVGSNPRNAESALKVGVSAVVGTSMQVQVSAVAGRVYSVWSADSLENPTWTRETTQVRATTTGPLRFTFSVSETTGKYLRVRAEF